MVLGMLPGWGVRAARRAARQMRVCCKAEACSELGKYWAIAAYAPCVAVDAISVSIAAAAAAAAAL